MTPNGQGLIEGQNDLALKSFAEFVTSPLDLPNEYAVLVRGERTVTSGLNKVGQSDTIYLFAERREKLHRAQYSASSTKQFGEERSRSRSWEQRLERDGVLYRRSRTPVGRYANKQSQDIDVSDEKAVIKVPAPQAYPMFLPFALDYECRAGRVRADFGSRILEKFDLKECKISENRELLTRWTYGTRDVLITFDPKQGDRPTEVIYMGADGRTGDTEELGTRYRAGEAVCYHGVAEEFQHPLALADWPCAHSMTSISE